MPQKTRGFIHFIGQTEQPTDKFKKRDLVIEVSEVNEATGNHYEHYEAFQLANNNVNIVDQFSVGDEVEITYSIRSNKVDKDGAIRYFTNLNAFRIDLVRSHNQPLYQQPQQYPPQQQFQQTPGPNGGQGYQQVNNDPDGLPF